MALNIANEIIASTIKIKYIALVGEMNVFGIDLLTIIVLNDPKYRSL
ncbi:MAG: hypothetical protein MJK08_00030 [Campylobacterales bacterium]|nr:hypothetical protein [Campylobacterales bacterium]